MKFLGLENFSLYGILWIHGVQSNNLADVPDRTWWLSWRTYLKSTLIHHPAGSPLAVAILRINKSSPKWPSATVGINKNIYHLDVWEEVVEGEVVGTVVVEAVVVGTVVVEAVVVAPPCNCCCCCCCCGGAMDSEMALRTGIQNSLMPGLTTSTGRRPRHKVVSVMVCSTARLSM